MSLFLQGGGDREVRSGMKLWNSEAERNLKRQRRALIPLAIGSE
jgi:hypothetical protein